MNQLYAYKINIGIFSITAKGTDIDLVKSKPIEIYNKIKQYSIDNKLDLENPYNLRISLLEFKFNEKYSFYSEECSLQIVNEYKEEYHSPVNIQTLKQEEIKKYDYPIFDQVAC